MGRSVAFSVLGAPVGKARPRVTRFGTYTPKETIVAEETIRREYAACSDLIFEAESPLRMYIDAHFPIPQSASAKKKKSMIIGQIRPTKKPDCDNIAKLVADALNQVAYYDDKQIVECVVRKFYDERPRLQIVIAEIDESFSPKGE